MTVRTLTIDGKMCTGKSGETIFNVAWNNGIRIPRLCHVGGISDVGACRLCMVQIEGRKKLAAACMTPVEEGMVVQTNTPTIKGMRQLIVELLFSERNHVCSICVMNGECELQELAQELGIDHIRLPYLFPRLGVDHSHERFGMDHNRCVLCTRCLRVCDEVEGAHTWDLAGRGVKSTIIADLGEPWGASDTCTGCGKCVQVCPTGALFSKGKSLSEMRKDRGFLKYIVTARKERIWIR